MVRIPLSEASLPCLDSLSLKLPSAFSCGFQNLRPEPTFIIWMCWPLFLLLLCPGSQGSNSLQSRSSWLLRSQTLKRKCRALWTATVILGLLCSQQESLQNPYSSRRLLTLQPLCELFQTSGGLSNLAVPLVSSTFPCISCFCGYVTSLICSQQLGHVLSPQHIPTASGA